MSIKDQSVIASANNALPPIGAPEGMAANTVNNTMREQMAVIKRSAGYTADLLADMTIELKARLETGVIINATSGTVAGDGFGGSFRWDSASIATVSNDVLISDEGGTGRWIRVIHLNSLRGVPKDFDTIVLAAASTSIVEGDVLLIEDRANSFWNVVLTSGVTPNTFDIVVSTGIPTLSLVLRFNETLNISALGAIPNAVTDISSLLQRAVDISPSVTAESGNYVLMSTVIVPYGRVFDCKGVVIFDGSSASFVGNNVIQVGTIVNTAIPNLASNVAKGDNIIPFISSHGLSIGDIFVIYDPTDFSFNSERAEYRAGEFCKVSTVISTTSVQVDGALYDSYAAATVDLYLQEMGSFGIIGSLKIIAGTPVSGTGSAITLNQVSHSTFTIEVESKNEAAYGVQLTQCFDVKLPDVYLRQGGNTGLGLDYALAINNSQHITSSGYFSAARHAVSHGGGAAIANVPCRDCHHSGSFFASSDAGQYAVDTHGNSEDISFSGYICGGATLSGKSIKLSGKVTENPSLSGICVILGTGGAMGRFDYDLSGCHFVAKGNPQLFSRGVVDVGGDGSFEVDDIEAGTLNLDNIIIDAPAAERGVVIRRRKTGTAELKVSMRNAKVNIISTGIPLLVDITNAATEDFKEVNYRDGSFNTTAAPNVSDTVLFKQIGQEGTDSVSTAISTNVGTKTVTFDQPFNIIPHVHVNVGKSSAGGKLFVGSVIFVNKTSFQMRVISNDGTQFTSVESIDFSWSAQ